jgi:hypothetical protein
MIEFEVAFAIGFIFKEPLMFFAQKAVGKICLKFNKKYKHKFDALL